MKKIYVLIILLLFIPFGLVKAADLTEYFSVNDIEICDDATCSIVYNEENGVNAGNKFLVKFKGELHSQSIINDGDTVTIPFANEPLTENTTSYECTGFSWSDIYDENGDKIGKWQMTGTVTDRKINIKFSDNAVGKKDVSGIFITPKNIKTKYTYVDKVVPLTVGDKVKNLKINTFVLHDASSSSNLQNVNSANNMIVLQAVSPRITSKQLYDVQGYPNLTNEAILSDLYFEFSLPSELNASINKLTTYSAVYLPISIDNLNVSTTGAHNFNMNYYFTEVTQNENETYQSFKNRLNEYEYGVYSDGENKVVVVNYGNQPSQDLTYAQIINRLDRTMTESGDYISTLNPFTINSQVKEILNNISGINNRIGGKVFAWGLFIYLDFSSVKVETTKNFTGIWSWKNASGEVKSEQKSVNSKLVVPQSIATASGTSQLLLRDYDSKNEIVGAKIKLQKQNGSAYEDVGEAITDSTGMVEFRNLESGTYRYIQTEYLPHYQVNSFKMYSDLGLSNVLQTFEFDKNVGNIIYATNEREKYTVTYKKGNHGNFDDQVYSDIPYGDPTPYYEPVGEEDWIFKGWSPDKEIFVTSNKAYTALWNKLVKVTARYLEVGTNNILLPAIEDKKENGTAYTTERKEITNYELVRVDGVESGTRDEEDITVTYYYKKKESNLNIKYLDCSTNREIANSTNETLYYGDNYDSDIYENNVNIPQNYNRTAASKSENYKGIVNSDSINVEYCYNKKDSNLNASITMTGTEKITKSTDKVSYKINYNTEYIDYIGSSTITVVDTLPYKIDVTNSNLDGGIYDDNNKTITWQITTNINSYSTSTYNVEKNIELKYKNINVKEDVIVNNVKGTTEIENKNTQATTLYNTYIDIKGNIIVKYLENKTNNELLESITTTDKVGKEYELQLKDIEGYRLVKKPEKEKVEYKEEIQEFKFLYERIKYKITVTSNEGGSVTGDEEVYYNEDSTLDNIKIKANENYYIKEIRINDRTIDIPEKSKELTIPQFKKMMEDKKIEVVFEKSKETVVVPNTLKKSTLIIFGVITVLGSVGIMLYILYKKKLIFDKIK